MSYENLPATIEQGGGELSLSRPPETVLKEAEMVVAPWGKRVEALQLYKAIGDKKHLYIEAWQMLAAMYRVTARIKETRLVQIGEVQGYEAIAEALHIPTGLVISQAEAMCLSDEEKWGPRTKYELIDGKRVPSGYVPTPIQQLRSMAQTRACSKVLSNLFKWVAVLKGYQGAPAEEMTGHEYDAPSAPSAPRRKSESAPPQQQTNGGTAPRTGGGIISEKQASRIWGIAHGVGKTKDEVIDVLRRYGFGTAKEVTTDAYEAICAEIQKGDGAE